MTILVIIIHVMVCVALIMIVLLQTGKGADMGAAFGGGSSQTLFGSTGGATFLSKATTAVAVIFMLTCFILAYISTHRQSSSIMEGDRPGIEQSAMEESPAQDSAAPPAESDASPENAE